MSWFSKTWKKITKPIKKIGKIVWRSTFGLPFYLGTKALNFIGNKVFAGKKIGRFFSGIGSFLHNAGDYFYDKTWSIFDNIADCDILGALNDILDLGLSAVSLIAALSTGNPYLIVAFGFNMDLKVNDGNAFLRPTVDGIASGLSHLGWHKAKEYQDEIYAVFGFATSIICSYGAGSYINALGIFNNLGTVLYSISAINSLYDGIRSYEEYQELKKEHEKYLKELEEYYEKLEADRKRADEKFLKIGLDFKLYDYFAGGKEYNAFSVGNDEYDYTKVRSPWAVILKETDNTENELMHNALHFRIYSEYENFYENILQDGVLFSAKRVESDGLNKIRKEIIDIKYSAYSNLADEYNTKVNYVNNVLEDTAKKLGKQNAPKKVAEDILNNLSKGLQHDLLNPYENKLTILEKEILYYGQFLE